MWIILAYYVKDAWRVYENCQQCQRAVKSITRRHETLQQPMIFCEVFDIWGIDFIGPFPPSSGFSYILLAVDYVSKLVEAIATRTNDARVVMSFVRSNIFCRFGIPRAIISDQGTHFCNKLLENMLKKYGVTHCVATPYHPKLMGKHRSLTRRLKRY